MCILIFYILYIILIIYYYLKVKSPPLSFVLAVVFHGRFNLFHRRIYLEVFYCVHSLPHPLSNILHIPSLCYAWD